MAESQGSASGEQFVQRRTDTHAYVVSFEDEEGAALAPVQLASTVLRHRRLVAAVFFGTGALSLALSLLLRRYYAESSFAPVSSQANISQFAGLAAQLGVSLGGVTGGESVDFYASLLKSRALLGEAVLTRYHFATDLDRRDSVAGDLIELYNVGGDTPERKLQKAIKSLNQKVTVTRDAEAGIVTLEVTAKWPALAEQINRRLLSLVNDFNLHKRQSQAGARRQFVEGRLQVVRAELDAAERDQATFLENNRTYQDSPRLRVEAARLQRKVELTQQVYVTLLQSYEQARIEEVRNIPVVTIVDEPEGSSRHTGVLALNVVVGLALGAMFGIAWAFGRDYVNHERAVHATTYAEFVQLRENALADLKRVIRGPLRVLRRLASSVVSH